MRRLGLLAALLACVGAPAHAAPARDEGATGAASRLTAAVNAPEAREAIARVAFAEAANQGDSGLAGVVYTILNRVASGRWGDTVEAVVNAPRQFEPVLRAGGDWRRLRAATAAERARVDTMLNLALDGRLPDLTGGALYFQNPRIVAARAAAGTVPAKLVDFGGTAPSARIGDHAFYVTGGGRSRAAARSADAGSGPIFVEGSMGPSPGVATPDRPSAPERGLFVLPDGQVAENRSP